MSRTTYRRRHAWVAATLLGALVTMGTPPVQAGETGIQVRAGGTCAVPPEDDVVIVPGGEPLPFPTPVPFPPGPPVPFPPGPPVPFPPGPPVPFPPEPLPQLPLPQETPLPAPLPRVLLGDNVGSAALRIQPGAFGIGGPGMPGTSAPAAYQGGPLRVGDLNYLPTEKMPEVEVAPEWGKTEFAPPDIEVGLTCVDAVAGRWKASVVKADQPVRQGVRLLTGVAEVDAALVRATAASGAPLADRCTTLVKMSDDLANEADVAGTGVGVVGPKPRPVTPTRYYMVAAVQAHEDLHLAHHKTALKGPFRTLRTSLEAAVVTGATGAEALASLRPTLDAAAKKFFDAVQDFATKEATHRPAQQYRDAEHSVVDPMVVSIGKHLSRLGCP